MIKPDALRRNISGLVNAYLEDGGLTICAQKMIKLTQEQAEAFYAEHKERPFFNTLITNITAGPVIVQVLRGDDGIKKNRDIMGPTNPAEAKEGTIRGDLAENIDNNTVHGADSEKSAIREIAFFFTIEEILK
jgi:nucleoside-diphosphate kinase